MVEIFDKDGNEIIDTDLDEEEHYLKGKRKNKSNKRLKSITGDEKK